MFLIAVMSEDEDILEIFTQRKQFSSRELSRFIYFRFFSAAVRLYEGNVFDRPPTPAPAERVIVRPCVGEEELTATFADFGEITYADVLEDMADSEGSWSDEEEEEMAGEGENAYEVPEEFACLEMDCNGEEEFASLGAGYGEIAENEDFGEITYADVLEDMAGSGRSWSEEEEIAGEGENASGTAYKVPKEFACLEMACNGEEEFASSGAGYGEIVENEDIAKDAAEEKRDESEPMRQSNSFEDEPDASDDRKDGSEQVQGENYETCDEDDPFCDSDDDRDKDWDAISTEESSEDEYRDDWRSERVAWGRREESESELDNGSDIDSDSESESITSEAYDIAAMDEEDALEADLWDAILDMEFDDPTDSGYESTEEGEEQPIDFQDIIAGFPDLIDPAGDVFLRDIDYAAGAMENAPNREPNDPFENFDIDEFLRISDEEYDRMNQLFPDFDPFIPDFFDA